jgi:hypothetical protein
VFSRRTAWVAEPDAAAPAALDLTVSNPCAVGLVYPPAFYRGLADERSAAYEPASLGLASARAAVADYYAARGAAVDLADLGLCASTSEAYRDLLDLLCDPGDAVLVPQPGYPLLRVIAELAGVELVAYPLVFDGRWSLDPDGLDAALAAAPRARAVVAVAPNNPTGSYLRADELAALDARCAARGLALIVDEVFWDYPLAPVPRDSPVDAPRAALTFVLSGLSKVAALPQLKLAWWLARGPAALVRAAQARLDIVADTFLSAATPVQLALPAILAAAPAMQAQISARTRDGLARVRAALADTAASVLPVEGGWLALVRLPAVGLDDVDWAARLLARGVRVQPGHLYDLHGPPHLAVSLLTPGDVLSAGCDRLRDAVAEVLTCGPCSR